MPPEQPEPRRRQEGNVIHLETQMRARLQAMVAWEARRTAREEVKRKPKPGPRSHGSLTHISGRTPLSFWGKRKRAARCKT
jgi:hypothetical protein